MAALGRMEPLTHGNDRPSTTIPAHETGTPRANATTMLSARPATASVKPLLTSADNQIPHRPVPEPRGFVHPRLSYACRRPKLFRLADIGGRPHRSPLCVRPGHPTVVADSPEADIPLAWFVGSGGWKAVVPDCPACKAHGRIRSFATPSGHPTLHEVSADIGRPMGRGIFLATR
jgi:hypothetical protein